MGLHSAVSCKLVQGILGAAERTNPNLLADAVLTAIGLNLEILHDADARISHEKFAALWTELDRRSGDPDIGLRMAEFAQPAILDVVGYAIQSSPNLKEAIRRAVRSLRILHQGVELTFKVQGKVARLTHAVPQASIPLHRVDSDFWMAGLLLRLRKMTGTDFVPLKAGFQHAAPTDISFYRQLFRSSVEFNQPVNDFVFDAAWLQQPLLTADPGLCIVLDRYIEELLVKLPQSESIVDSVRREIGIGLRDGNPGLSACALRLGFDKRTLQRKLKQAGVSYQELLDEMRRELSMYYLQEQHLPAHEVAFLLGFSETSTFHRAFKRWTGTTPGEFRVHSLTNTPKL